MILPHFDYGDVIYSSSSSTDPLNELQVLQNKCLRACTNLLLDTEI